MAGRLNTSLAAAVVVVRRVERFPGDQLSRTAVPINDGLFRNRQRDADSDSLVAGMLNQLSAPDRQ